MGWGGACLVAEGRERELTLTCVQLLGDGLGADLISRQKELDRQQARKLVKQDTDREMQELQMTVHRINKAVNSSAASRPMMLPAEVGAKISQRDRALREKQQRDAQQRRGVEGRHGMLRGFNDVAHDGALYSPTKQFSGGGGGVGYLGDGIDDDIEDEIGVAPGRGGRVLSPPQEVDEELRYACQKIPIKSPVTLERDLLTWAYLSYYEKQEAHLEQELAQRTLKIQMLKTAILQ